MINKIFRKTVCFLLFFIFQLSHAQSDVDKVLRAGELIVNGLSFIKTKKSDSNSENSKVIESVCVKNKHKEKITFNLLGKDADGKEIKKELVILTDGKECVFELLKGIWTYEIVLPNKEIFKKGEYKFEEEVTITIKE